MSAQAASRLEDPDTHDKNKFPIERPASFSDTPPVVVANGVPDPIVASGVRLISRTRSVVARWVLAVRVAAAGVRPSLRPGQHVHHDQQPQKEACEPPPGPRTEATRP